jgi:hypothetical protein
MKPRETCAKRTATPPPPRRIPEPEDLLWSQKAKVKTEPIINSVTHALPNIGDVKMKFPLEKCTYRDF